MQKFRQMRRSHLDRGFLCVQPPFYFSGVIVVVVGFVGRFGMENQPTRREQLESPRILDQCFLKPDNNIMSEVVNDEKKTSSNIITALQFYYFFSFPEF
jgi:hypothetical protein